MSRSKKEVFESMWIDIEKRLPPETEKFNILGWNKKLNRATVTCGAILVTQRRQLRSGVLSHETIDPNLKHTGYFITKWMFVHPPEEDR